MKRRQKGIKEAREKVVVEMKEMIEKGLWECNFWSERIRPGEYIERKKGELEKKGQTAGDRVLSRHLAEANRDEEERRIREKVRAETWRKKGRRINRLVRMSVSS